MIGALLSLLIVGLIAGLLARAVVPGDDSMSLKATLLLGVIGSLVGGLLGYLVSNYDAADGWFQPSGIIGSVIGSVIALLVWRQISARRGSKSASTR